VLHQQAKLRDASTSLGMTMREPIPAARESLSENVQMSGITIDISDDLLAAVGEDRATFERRARGDCARSRPTRTDLDEPRRANSASIASPSCDWPAPMAFPSSIVPKRSGTPKSTVLAMCEQRPR
jgi:hypothetical protein